MKPRAAAVLLASAAALLQFAGLGDRDLWMPDEPREAEIARAYASREGWAVPRMNGGRWLEKPPLWHWATATLFRATGSTSPALARLPSALAAFGIGLCAWALGGPWAALLAWTSASLLQAGHSATVDCLFAFLVTLALTCAAMQRPAGCWDIACAFLAGLAFLTKFHLGPVLVLACLGAWTLLARRRMRPSPLPILVFLAAAAPWPACVFLSEKTQDDFETEVARLAGTPPPRISMGREALSEVLWGQLLSRSKGNRYGHAEPAWYYLPNVLTFAAPWSLVLAAAIPWGLGRLRRGGGREAFSAVWIVSSVVLLSLPRSKRVVYLLPCIAPTAVLAAAWGRGTLDRLERRGLLKGAGIGLALVAAAAGLAFPWLARAAAPGQSLPGAFFWAMMLAALALLATALKPRGGLALLAAWPMAAALAVGAVIVPARDRIASFRDVADAVRRHGAGRAIEGYRLAENVQGAVAFALASRVRVTGEPAHVEERLRMGRRVVLMPMDACRELEKDPRTAGLVRLVDEAEAHGLRFAVVHSVP